ncbi:hypothetical protein CDCA_CDCA04G1301 [Cyanidium caldarium]|uniref:NADP-dependent oxidoreductase domain-containing protein n=1 Tax=Cyanidium caldarium TaxID=2771 RepID=A0AAV9IT61_CYACA|nr:hypothetical protein CDCA_CDCA04G1301 [Cyanidium caldarium]
MERRRLGSTGYTVSELGFGASPLGGVFGPITSEEDAVRAVREAVDAHGINLFDTSPYYGNTESERVLGKCLSQLGDRDAYVLATKVGRYGRDEFDYSAARVRASVVESMQRLRVRRLDIVQCHDVEFADRWQIIAEETLPALARLRDEGVIGAIGLTGLPLSVYPTILEHTAVEVDVALSYCHACLCDTSLADSGVLRYLYEKGVGVLNASPLCMGLLTERGPPPWHPAPPALKAHCAAAARWVTEHAMECTGTPVTIAELALPYAVRCVGDGRIASTLVGIDSHATLSKNVQALRAPLNERLLQQVLRMLAPVHNQSWPSGAAWAQHDAIPMMEGREGAREQGDGICP